MKGYREDIAHIHDDRFDHFAVGAGHTLLRELHERAPDDGVVVDVGCGGGTTAVILANAGYRVVGVDLSESLIEIARGRAPSSEFHVASFVDFPLPRCIAVSAIGEILNYAFDERNNEQNRNRFFRRVYDALDAEGVFVFDIAGPSRGPANAQKNFYESDDWTLLVETFSDERMLTRRLTSFRRRGAMYRREKEMHRLHLIPPAAVADELESIGFRVTHVSNYGDQPLPAGLHGFIARKSSASRSREMRENR